MNFNDYNQPTSFLQTPHNSLGKFETSFFHGGADVMELALDEAGRPGA